MKSQNVYMLSCSYYNKNTFTMYDGIISVIITGIP